MREAVATRRKTRKYCVNRRQYVNRDPVTVVALGPVFLASERNQFRYSAELFWSIVN